MTQTRPLDMDPSPALSDRRIGVEIEFTGLPEARVAQVIAGMFGGHVQSVGRYVHRVEGTRLGDMRVELDTAFKAERAGASDFVTQIAHQLIPAEIVTAPLPEQALPELDRLAERLRAEGAQGTRAALVNGFGVHFNVEQTDHSLAALLPVLQAWALLEPWLRAHEPMGIARRALPFTSPWPDTLRRRLFDLDPATDSVADLTAMYLALAPSRNFGLDMLPLLRQIDPGRVEARLGPDAPSARPTWHFRLPSCRIDEDGWTVTGEWEKWQLVEALAAMPRLRADAAEEWCTRYHGRILGESAWVERLTDILKQSRG